MIAAISSRRRLHLGASAAPISLLFLPKCPLCLVPLLAFLGVAIPAAIGLWIVAGVLLASWLVFLIVAARRQPLIRIVASVAAAVSVVAIVLQSTLLLLPAVVAMTAAGLALSRSCAIAPRAPA